VFCQALVTDDAAPLVLHRGRTCFIILNLFPYNSGHLMIVPNRHVGSLAALTPDELCELGELSRLAEMAVTEAYAPHGMNTTIWDAGRSGVSIMHVHVVPRWSGDTNFMTVVGETRVLPEELSASAEKLRPVFERLSQSR
jgi:ATP adenylyltransferase